MIPLSFEQWQHCIIHECGITLTKDFAKQRMEVYKNQNHPETKKFVSLYGSQHLDHVLQWFGKIING